MQPGQVVTTISAFVFLVDLILRSAIDRVFSYQIFDPHLLKFFRAE